MMNDVNEEYIEKIATVLLDEINKYFPGIIYKKYDSFGLPNKEGSDALDRAKMCLKIELLKAGAFEKLEACNELHNEIA